MLCVCMYCEYCAVVNSKRHNIMQSATCSQWPPQIVLACSLHDWSTGYEQLVIRIRYILFTPASCVAADRFRSIKQGKELTCLTNFEHLD